MTIFSSLVCLPLLDCVRKPKHKKSRTVKLHIAQEEFENVQKVAKEDIEIETLCNEVFVSARVHEDFDLYIDDDELLNVTNEVEIDASVADSSSDLNGVHLHNSEIGKLNDNLNTK